LPFVHDGSTRKWWVLERLTELNLGVCQQHDLPSDDLLRIISELFEPDDFERQQQAEFGATHNRGCLADLNKLLKRQGLTAYLHDTGQCFVRNTGTGVDSTSISRLTRPLSKEEAEQRERLRAFLGSASEDEFTERVLLPYSNGSVSIA